MKKPKMDIGHLWKAYQRDKRRLQPFSEKRLDLIKQFAGFNYSDNGSSEERPLNLIALYVRVILGYLVGADPRMMVSTFNPSLRPIASVMQESGNRRLVRIGFKDVLERATMDSLFLMGIVRTAITAPAEARFGGYRKEAGEVCQDVIDFDDFCYDTRAKTSFYESGYLSHRYFVLYDDVKESRLFDKKARDQLMPITNQQYNQETGVERTTTVSQGNYDARVEDFEERVELIEAYLPRLNRVVTFDAHGDHSTALLEQDWIGPACGPYTFMSQLQMPGNLMPKAPLMDLKNLDQSSNVLWKKLDNQAFEQKDVIFYLDSEEAEKLKNAGQGAYIQSSNPDGTKRVSVGGVNQEVFVHMMQGQKIFNEHAGNLAVLGGLASQAGTAKQEGMLQENASVLIKTMSRKTVAFAQECMRSLAWFDWHHPFANMESEYHPPGLPEFSRTRVVRPLDRIGLPFEELDLQIDPYSLVYQTPQAKLAIIDQMMKEVFLPAIPMFSQPGVGELLQAYVRMKAKFANVPELIELMEKLTGIQTAQNQEAGGQGGGVPQSPQPGPQPPSDGVYQHVSQPGMTDQGHEQVMQQLMLGSRPQGKGVEQILGQPS